MPNGHGGFPSGTPGARILELEEQNKKLRDEIKKLEYALEQIRSMVVEITG